MLLIRLKLWQNYGPDATRWYMISNANPWENLKFDIEGIDEVRKFFGTLYNIFFLRFVCQC
jgi:isoleucyl-tRNA synthetase